MTRLYPAVIIAFALNLLIVPGRTARAQQEGIVPTQAMVNVDAKSKPPASASVLTVEVNGHKEPLSDWAPVLPGNAQVALLIDDGLRESVGREVDNLRSFVEHLPPGVEVMVGYMRYGSVAADHGFTTDHALAANDVHQPGGLPGMSASPYLCLSDFVKKWGAGAGAPGPAGSGVLALPAQHKARFAIMITDGVDPYNGSTGVNNQDSPYVTAAIEDSQRAGVAVSAIYYSDAGIRGGSADFSGQNYLTQLTQATGGVNYFEMAGNPVSTAPFLKMFQSAIAETYVATFPAPTGKDPQRDMVRVKFSSADKAKLHASEKVRPGNVE